MKEWKENKVRYLIKQKNGYTWSKEQELQKYEDNSIRVLTVSNIQKELDLSVELYLQNVSEEDKIEKKVSKNWIIAVSSNGNRNRIGNPVFIKENMDFLFASFLTAFKPKDENELLPEFFFYWMSSNQVQQKITAVSEGTTGLGNMNIRHFKNMKIVYPELQEQAAIAGIISKVDQCIENVQKSIEATQKLKKSLMQNLLTGRMKPDGTMRKDDEFYEHPKMGKVPIGWDVKKLKDVALNRGDYGSNSSAIPFSIDSPRFIRITDISDEGQLFKDDLVSSTDNTDKYLLHDDDFLFARTGDTVGKSLLYKEKMGKAIFAGYLIRFVLNKEIIIPEYFDLIAKSEYFEAFKVSMKRVGVKPNINSREYCSFRFILPKDENEQSAILGFFDTIIKKIIESDGKINCLQRLKKSLMQNLLTGKKRVDVDKINSLLESMK